MRYVPESHVQAEYNIHVTIRNENMAVFLNGPAHEMFYTYNKVNKRQKLRRRIAC